MDTNNDIIMPDITEDDVIADLQEIFLKLRKERLNRKFKPKKPVQKTVLPTDESRRLQGPMRAVQQGVLELLRRPPQQDQEAPKEIG